jgi:hypothetical protein
MNALDRVAVDDQLHVLADPNRLAGLRDGDQLDIRVRNPLAELLRQQRGRRLTVVVPENRQERPADELFRLVTQDETSGRIDVRETSLRVARVDEVLRLLDDLARAVLCGGVNTYSGFYGDGGAA